MSAPAVPLPIRRRLALLTVASGVGAALFLPFLSAASGRPVRGLGGFVGAVTASAALAAWAGLRAADAVGLPMPLLRAWEAGARPPWSPRTAARAAGCGLALGALGLALLRVARAPTLPGDVLARALSVGFAAVPLEVVVHLLVMSGVVRLARGRRWPGVAAAALALVAFHLSDAATQPASVVGASVVGNGAVAAVLGVVYAAYGFEYAVLGHAVAHLVTVLAG